MTKESRRLMCEYPNCQNIAKEEYEKYGDSQAKLCDVHDKELVALLDENDIPNLVSFMMKFKKK